jgi:hypothetical protein
LLFKKYLKNKYPSTKLTIMKKTFLTLAIVAFLSLTATSCSTDDSALNDDTSADLIIKADNGDRDLPKPPIRN